MNIINIALGVDTQPCSSITLGRRGENEVTQVVVDFSSWVEEFGAGVITLLAMRSQDTSAYPVVLTLDGNAATWDVTSTDTAYKGSGRAEFIYTVGEQIAKSVVFNTVVMQDIGEPSETPPDPYEDWLERLTELGAETQANAQVAEQSAADAAVSAESAARSAASIEGDVEQAEEAARQAKAAKVDAEAAKVAAETAKDGAVTAKQGAEAAATNAGSSAGAAAQSAQEAETAKTAAAGSASDALAAKNSAEQAQQKAEEEADSIAASAAQIEQNRQDIADQKSAIDNVEASLATVETTSTASKAYAVGDLLVYGGRLYRVASVIAAGATLRPNTNISPVTVEDELERQQAEIDRKQDAIEGGVLADALGFDTNNNIIPVNDKTRLQPYSVNNYTTVFRGKMVVANSTATRNGFLILYNKILIRATTNSTTTRRWMNLLTSDGTIHTFTGAYNDASIPINASAWVDFRELFPTDSAYQTYLTAANNHPAFGLAASWAIYVYFGKKADDGTITSVERLPISLSSLMGIRTLNITAQLNNPEYNVMALYLDDRNRNGKTEDILVTLDMLYLPIPTA